MAESPEVAKRRAIGIVRVSAKGEREGESFVTPVTQRERIEAAAERDNIAVRAIHEEIDVSGGKPLAERPGLSVAVEAIEAGEADVLMVAYFDRLVRSLRVQDEVVSRVEAAGGKVLTLDFGEVSGATAAQWLSGTVIGTMSEYYRRSTGERASEAQARAVARGAAPFLTPVGYLRGDDGVLIPDPDTAPLIREAIQMRAAGSTIREVRTFLTDRGIKLSYNGVNKLLRNRVYLGEIHFGELVNLSAHEPIVDRDIWQAAQRMTVTRGRQAKSDRLLARLGVLVCGTCGSRMSVCAFGSGKYRSPGYGCPATQDCERRAYVKAEVAEQTIAEAVRQDLADDEARASHEREAREAAAAAERTQADLDAALRAFAGLEDEAAAVERLDQLRKARDDAREHAGHLGGLGSSLVIGGVEAWDSGTLAERRAIIRLTVRRATVRPGRGPGRISTELFSQQAPGDSV